MQSKVLQLRLLHVNNIMYFFVVALLPIYCTFYSYSPDPILLPIYCTFYSYSPDPILLPMYCALDCHSTQILLSTKILHCTASSAPILVHLLFPFYCATIFTPTYVYGFPLQVLLLLIRLLNARAKLRVATELITSSRCGISVMEY